MDRSWENINCSHRHMNVEIGTETAYLIPKKRNTSMGFSLQCTPSFYQLMMGDMFAARIFLIVEVQAQSLMRCSEASALFRQPPLKYKGRLHRYTDNKNRERFFYSEIRRFGRDLVQNHILGKVMSVSWDEYWSLEPYQYFLYDCWRILNLLTTFLWDLYPSEMDPPESRLIQ